MKIKLNEALLRFDAFTKAVNEDAVVAAPPAPKSATPREAIVTDVNNIITSLETLATKITEEVEAIEEEGPSILGDLIRLPKYIGTQKKINKMKISAEEINFAAQNETDKASKAKLKEKYNAVKDQVKQLEADFTQKVQGRASLIKRSVGYVKMQGQMDLLKVIYGVTPDADEKAKIKERMADLGTRMKEEADAVKELRKKAEDKKAEDAPAQTESFDMHEFVNGVIELELELFEDEDLEDLNEATTDKGANLSDYFIYAPRYVKVQKRINKMKLQSNDLGFAAAGLGKSAAVADKKAALVDKKRMLDDQIKQLQNMLDDKMSERGPRVKRKVEQTKIQGQIELLNHMLGRETDPNDARDLKQRMADLKKREQEEAEALQKYADQAEEIAVDVKQDNEIIKLQGELADLKNAVKAAKEAGEDATAVKKLELEAAEKELELRVEQGNVDATATAKEKIFKLQKQMVAMDNEPAADATDNDAAKDVASPAEDTPAPADPKEAKTLELEAEIKQLKDVAVGTQNEISKMETQLKALEEEKAKATNPASFDEKINRLKADIDGFKQDLKANAAEQTAKIKELQALQSKNEAVEIDEASTSWKKMMQGVKAGEQGPWTLVVIDKTAKKVVKQEEVKVQDALPAHYEALRKEWPKAMIQIEDSTGQVVWNESLQIDENINKNALINRAAAVGLTSLIEEINAKQEWQLNKTALYSKYNTVIATAENAAKLTAEKHSTGSIKDRMSKLL